MLSIIIFLLVISAFSVFAAFRYEKDYELTIATGCLGIIIFMYLFGLLGLLKPGAVFVCLLAAGLYLATVINCYKSMQNGDSAFIKNGLSHLFSTGFFVFCASAIVFIYISCGRLAIAVDEFSHWLQTVKIMATIDAFGTREGSWATFASYPPAMSLLQYLLEKLSRFCGAVEFSEWKPFFVYKLFGVAVMLPFLSFAKRSVRKNIVNVVLWIGLLIIPISLFPDYYSSLYIDGILGVMCGSGFAAVLLWKEKDWLYNGYIVLLCSVLAITKDIGILLSAFIFIEYLVDFLARCGFKFRFESIKDAANYYLGLLSPMLGFLITKSLWALEVNSHDVIKKFSAKIDLNVLIRVILGDEISYYREVLTSYKQAALLSPLFFDLFEFNYKSLILFVSLINIAMLVILYKRGTVGGVQAAIGVIAPTLLMVLYILGLLPMYIFKFEKSEALAMASFDRYMGIVVLAAMLAGWIYIKFVLEEITDKHKLIIFYSVLAISYMGWTYRTNIKNLFNGESIAYSVAYRTNSTILAGKILDICGSDDKIALFTTAFNHSEASMINFTTEPYCEVHDNWQEDGLESYDYVAVLNPNDELKAEYSYLFDDEIIDCSLYTFNNGVLVRVQ